MSNLYLESSPEFKNGIGLEFGAKMRILKVGSNPRGGGQSAKMKNGLLTNRNNCFELMRSTGMKNRVI